MKVPKLVFLDLDGTLLTSDRRITPRTVAAIARLQKAGVRFSLATGRVFSSAKPYADQVRADAPLVLFNGARIQDPVSGAVAREWRLDAALARIALDALAGWDVHISLFHDEAIYIPAWSERARDSAAKDGVTFTVAGDLRNKLDRAPLKMMTIGDVAVMDRLHSHLRGRYGGVAPAIVRTEPTYIELWHAEASKAVAARAIAAQLGIAMADVAAFGDNPNDLDLIRASGLGVAMANAHPDVRAAAHRVAPSNDDEGVAQVLEELAG